MSAEIKKQTDEQLVMAYKLSGDKTLVGELFKRHSILCFAVCVKYLKNEDAAHDAVMSIFEKLFTDLNQHEISSFRNWLHSVARNYCLMQLRKPMFELYKNVWVDEENDGLLMENYTTLHPLDEVTDKEKKFEALTQALTGLNQQQRLCVELFYLKQLSYEQIAATTGLSMNEVKSYIQNGKRNLKLRLAEQGISLAITLLLWVNQYA